MREQHLRNYVNTKSGEAARVFQSSLTTNCAQTPRLRSCRTKYVNCWRNSREGEPENGFEDQRLKVAGSETSQTFNFLTLVFHSLQSATEW